MVWVKVIHEGRGSWYGSRSYMREGGAGMGQGHTWGWGSWYGSRSYMREGGYVGVGMGGCQSPNNVYVIFSQSLNF